MIPTIKYRRLICAGADSELLKNEDHLRNFLYNAAEECRCIPEKHFSYQFPEGGKGISSVLIVGESHIIIHTWPEHNYFTLSAEVCSEEADLAGLERVLKKFFPNIEINENSA